MDSLIKVVTFIVGWTLGLITCALLMVPVYWFFKSSEESPAGAILAAALGSILLAPTVMIGRWWNKRYGRIDKP